MRNTLNWMSLIILALGCGLLWRLEVEWHGWGGLHWISYFHWAVPISAILVILWLNFQMKLPQKKRVLWNIFGLCHAFGSLWFFQESLYMMFGARFGLPFSFLFVPISILVSWPILVFITLRKNQYEIRYVHLIISMLIVFASFPISSLFLDWVDHKGGEHIIDVIKSGFAIPWIVLSVGYPVLFAKRNYSN